MSTINNFIDVYYAGAGKSTLLDVLSGYRKTGVSGSVYINGRIRNLGKFILKFYFR